MIELSQIRRFALSLPEVTEEPHFQYTSFRVRGKIFATVPPQANFLHVFVGDREREIALALEPGFIDKLLWGGKVVGLRVDLSVVSPKVAKDLVMQAGESRAPKSLLKARQQQAP